MRAVFLAKSLQKQMSSYLKTSITSFKNIYFNPNYNFPFPISSVCLGCNESMRINLTKLNQKKEVEMYLHKLSCCFKWSIYHVCHVLYIYWIRCSKEHLLRVCQLRALTADRLQRWKHFQNKKKLPCVIKRKKRKWSTLKPFEVTNERKKERKKSGSSLVWRWMQGWGNSCFHLYIFYNWPATLLIFLSWIWLLFKKNCVTFAQIQLR